MWLLIPEGFYSIVQKEGEEELCVRARVHADLDRPAGVSRGPRSYVAPQQPGRVRLGRYV